MKISIIIPTRERSQYLRHSVQTALQIEDANIEIVVSDNASSDDTQDLVQTLDDPRLVYVNTGARLSMRENFEYAFNAATGDYLIFFGDDDGLLPKQFKFLRQILETYKPDGVSWINPNYGWPVKDYGKSTGRLRLYPEDFFGAPKPYQGSDNLKKLLAADVGNLRPVPRIYHGCLSRDYMLKTSMDKKTVFDSAIPDINLSYRSILKDGNFIGVDHPFSINGHSPASTGGGHGAAQKNRPQTGSSELFAQENKTDKLSDVMPHAKSVPLAFFSTLETLRRNHGLDKFQPDYFCWYHYVLGSGRRNAELAKALHGILTDHAVATGTTEMLSAALAAPPKAKRSLKENLSRLRRKLDSIRVATLKDGENTILTAANTMDSLLGEDFGAVLSGEMEPRKAWKQAKRRSKGFKRRL